MLKFITSLFSRTSPPVRDGLTVAECGPLALALILECEGLDQPWMRPPGNSGITIGVGFDLGYCTAQELDVAWSRHLDQQSMLHLHCAVGKKGAAAEALEQRMKLCQRISKDAAYEVFERCTLPKWRAVTAKTFPGLEVLTPDQQGVLVSLIFNRGPSLSGPRRREMACIRDILTNRFITNKADAIAAQILSMRRLWPDIPGLQRRRLRESNLMKSETP